MNRSIDSRITVVSPEESIDSAIRKMAKKRSVDQIDGIAVAVDEDSKVLGVITDGDIRRAYAKNVSFESRVDEIMVKDPVVIRNDENPRDLISRISSQVSSKARLTADMVRHVIAVDEQGRLDSVIDVTEFLLKGGSSLQNVAVHGLGYVGLTIAVTLANIGHRVFGVDSNAVVRSEIEHGRACFHESGLQDMLTLVRDSNTLTAHESLDHSLCSVHIVAVGTPINMDGSVDDSALSAVARDVGKALKRGDLVQLRSTVPVGYTRTRFLPELLKNTRLKEGRDFYLAFCPERTIEGEALKELRSLPQIVGGLSSKCLDKAAVFWSTVTNTIVYVESLEAAELVKLANNTFRDLSFGFANELAELCDKYNLDAFKMIAAANEGYPRNRIPGPSPGVGGYCLTKDPLIYNTAAVGSGLRATLGAEGRKVNLRAAEYPRTVLERWVKRLGRPVGDIRVVCVGMAFKGFPETGDLRESIGVELAHWLAERTPRLEVWDAVSSRRELKKKGFKVSMDIRESLRESDAIFILNNNPAHTLLGIPLMLKDPVKPRLVFDGWHQMDRNEIERIPGVVYATMGYMTPKD